MARSSRPPLTIPAALVVTVLGVGCPAGDDGDTGNETGPSTTGPATSSESGTASGATETTVTGGPTGTSGVDSGTATGELPDCNAIEDEATCDATPECQYLGELGCQLFCDLLEDEATCVADPFCEWDDGGAGGEGNCYAPI